MFETQVHMSSTPVLRGLLKKLLEELSRCKDYVVATAIVDDLATVTACLARR